MRVRIDESRKWIECRAVMIEIGGIEYSVNIEDEELGLIWLEDIETVKEYRDRQMVVLEWRRDGRTGGKVVAD